jgi:hypothetical protein
MYSEFATDPKVQMMPEVMQRRFVMALCLRCGNGNVTLQDEEVAFQLRISNEDWLETKAYLQSKGLLDCDGLPTNWDKRQYASDSSNERVKAYRDRKKQACNVTVTTPETETETETKKEKEKEKEPIRNRGTRLPVDFVLPADWILFCQQERNDLNPTKVFEEFKDYWTALPAGKGTKADWTATWRNWVRRQSVPKQGFAQQAADIARSTVPARHSGPDPVLLKIEQDRQKAVPMPEHIRQQISKVLRKA